MSITFERIITTALAGMNCKARSIALLILITLGLTVACTGKKEPEAADSTEKEAFDRLILHGDSLLHIDPEGVIRTARQMVKTAEATGDWNKIGRIIQLLAAAYHTTEKPDSALFYLNRTKKFEKEITDKFVHTQLFNEFGKAYRLLNNNDSSLYYFKMVAEAAEDQSDIKLKMSAANNLAMVLSDMGNKSAAYDSYLSALRYAEELNDIRNKAIILNNLALIDNELKNYKLAIERFREAIRINKENNRFYDLSMNYGNLAIVFGNMDQDDSAIFYNNTTIALAREKGFVRDLARALVNGGMAYAKKGNHDKARKYLLEADEICRKHGIVYGLYFTNTGLYGIERDLGNHQQSLRYLDSANKIVEMLGDPSLNAGLLKMYAEANYSLANYQKAHDYLLAHQRLSDSLREIANENHISELQTRYETEKKELENKQLRTENQSQQQRVRLMNTIILFVGIALLVTLLLIFLQLRNRRKLKQFNKQLTHLNTEINQKNIELLQANQTKDKLFSVIAHDLKSPFNALMGLLEILVKDEQALTEEEKQELLKRLYKQTDYTYGTLENLLQWAMSKRNLITASIQEMKLYDAVAAELDFLAARAAEKKIALENSIDPELIVQSDPLLVRNIVRNLVNNSIKFSPEGTKVVVENILVDGKHALVVNDQGIGISQEIIRRLMENEFIDSTRGTKNEKGTGLGLQMVKEFVNIINAELQVESTPGAGTRITIIFP